MSSGASGQPRDFGPINTHAVHDIGYGTNRKQVGKAPPPGSQNRQYSDVHRDQAPKLSLQSKGKEKKKGAKAI